MTNILLKLAVILWALAFISAQINNTSEDGVIVTMLMNGNIREWNITSSNEISGNTSVAYSFEEQVFYSIMVDFYFEIKMSDDNKSVENYIIRNASEGIMFKDREYHWKTHNYNGHLLNKTVCEYTITHNDRELKKTMLENGTYPKSLIFECHQYKCCGLKCCSKENPIFIFIIILLISFVAIGLIIGAVLTGFLQKLADNARESRYYTDNH